MSRWKAVGVVVEGDPIDVGGLNPWKFQWQDVREEPVELPHPSYPNQRHSTWIYEVAAEGKRVRFAAAELSAGVWGFYVPERSMPPWRNIRKEGLMDELKPGDREVISSRIFPAARETVFNAVRDPAILARWWGPAGFRNRFDVFEFRPGGAWRFTMVAPDGAEYPTVSRFDEITPPERIVLSHLEPGHHFRMTMTFDAAGAGTRLTWRMEFDSATEVERIGAIVAGCNEQNFDRLAAELARGAEGR